MHAAWYRYHWLVLVSASADHCRECSFRHRSCWLLDGYDECCGEEEYAAPADRDVVSVSVSCCCQWGHPHRRRR